MPSRFRHPTRLEATRLEQASLLSCMGEPLRRNVEYFLIHRMKVVNRSSVLLRRLTTMMGRQL